MVRTSSAVRALLCTAAILAGTSAETSALTLKDFNERMKPEERSSYVTGAVSILMFNYADQGNKQMSICINSWYFRPLTTNGERIGAAGMAREVARVSGIDATYHVEEIIIDMIKKTCGASSGR
jgi:hypothetical protein